MQNLSMRNLRKVPNSNEDSVPFRNFPTLLVHSDSILGRLLFSRFLGPISQLMTKVTAILLNNCLVFFYLNIRVWAPVNHMQLERLKAVFVFFKLNLHCFWLHSPFSSFHSEDFFLM